MARRPWAKVLVDAGAKLALLAHAIAPGLGRWTMNRMLELSLANLQPQTPDAGALFEPGSNGGISGHLPLGRIMGLDAVALVSVASAATVLGHRR